MEQRPAMTNTKAEILAAYNDLLKRKKLRTVSVH